MPLLSLSAEAALKNRRDSRALWPTRERRAEDLYPIALPKFEPSFTITRNDRIFCLGSCFAREIEAVLSRAGFTVLSRQVGADFEAASGNNLYSVAAIEQAIRGAFGGGKSDRQFRAVSEATVVLITLGLSEVWYDHEAGCYLNLMPPVKQLRGDAGRYELHLLSFAETEGHLRRALQLLRSSPNSPRVLLTVSPIPLHNSFRAGDVFLSNAYSKSVLRTAVEAVRFDMTGVDYFPSYEMATLSDHRAVWGDADFRHVDRKFVTVITSHALAGLMPDESAEFMNLRDDARADLAAKLASNGRRQSILERIESRLAPRILSSRKLRKYRRGRDAFFEDASYSIVRAYGRLTR